MLKQKNFFSLVILFSANFSFAATTNCDNQKTESQIREQIVASLTNLEIRVDEVENVKINSLQVQSAHSRKHVAFTFTTTLREPSLLSRSVYIADPARRSLNVTLSAILGCEPNSVSSRSILLDNKIYNDVAEDDRNDIGKFNEANVDALRISK